MYKDRKISSIESVVEFQLCTGCGLCQYLEPDRYKIVNIPELGNRPITLNPSIKEPGDAFIACPGHTLTHNNANNNPQADKNDISQDWGPILEIWEGYATDSKIRFSGSSGGLATALSAFCIEKKGMEGALHISARKDNPIYNETVFSKTSSELIARSGSRYSPASPCDGLDKIESSEKPCVFIGKPCDVAAVTNATRLREQLKNNLGIKLAFFCAGVPSTYGTEKLIKKFGITNFDKIKTIRYRGRGWPGSFRVETDTKEKESEINLSYNESWSYLQQFRQWRCYICPDHTGEFADIAVGDPWYRPIKEHEDGSSIIIVRTENGRKILKEAVSAGYVTLTQQNDDILPLSQKNLLNVRRSLWGRLFALRLLGAGTPSYSGFNLYESWRANLSAREKILSILSTAKRIYKKRLTKKLKIQDM